MTDFKMNGRMGRRGYKEPMLTRMVTSVFNFVRVAEFEILFFLFFFIAFLIFKDLVSLPSFPTVSFSHELNSNFEVVEPHDSWIQFLSWTKLVTTIQL